MNTDRPSTLEEVTASAEAQIRAAEETVKTLARNLAVRERYARILRKKWKRAEALVHVREDE